MDLGELTGVIAVFFGGCVMLTPLLALSARFAIKPLIDSMTRLREVPIKERTSLNDRRIEVLEAEVESLRRLIDAQSDRRAFDALLTESRRAPSYRDLVAGGER